MQIIGYGYLVNDRTRYPLKSLGGQQRTGVTLFLTYSHSETQSIATQKVEISWILVILELCVNAK